MSNTVCEAPIVSEPIKFLGASVLSFQTSLGLGSAESTLNVDLVEDCEADPPDEFVLKLTEGSPGYKCVGDPVYFTAGSMTFGGIISSWSKKQDSGGLIYNVKISDPRQLLQNAVVIVDSYNGAPIVAANYINAYHHLEQGLCADFGMSFNTEQGTPYLKIMEALEQIDPFICAPHFSAGNGGDSFRVKWSDFPGVNDLPQYFRLQGPAIPVLELLTAACEMSGYEFFVYLVDEGGPMIRIGLIDLKIPPTSFSQLVDSFDGTASELSFGEELRNEKTKTMMIGENVHYMSYVDKFFPYFGEDVQNGERVQVIPYGWDNSGFWFLRTVTDLNPSLINPFPNVGPYQISELDIRAAMSSFQAWAYWVFINEGQGSLNDAIRTLFPLANEPGFRDVITAIRGDAGAITTFQHFLDGFGRTNGMRAMGDIAHNPSRGRREANKPDKLEDLEKIHAWLSNLGQNHYGRTYMTPLNENVCYYLTDFVVNNGQYVFSSNPVDAGWVDPGIPVLDLADPFLEIFRDESGKLNGFAVFNTSGTFESPENPDIGYPESGGDGGGGGLAGFCWVAREVYGSSNVKWLEFRDWMMNRSPRLIKGVYGRYGERFAQFIKNKPIIKSCIKKIMDLVLYFDRRG